MKCKVKSCGKKAVHATVGLCQSCYNYMRRHADKRRSALDGSVRHKLLQIERLELLKTDRKLASQLRNGVRRKKDERG